MNSLLLGIIIGLVLVASGLVIAASLLRCKKCGKWCEDETECRLNQGWDR